MLRRRATAVVVRNDKLLLVRDKGVQRFALPGGGVNSGELAISAVARELHEETRLEAVRIEFLFTYIGEINEHLVYRVDAKGDVIIDNEIEAYTWWDWAEDIPLEDHIKRNLSRLNEERKNSTHDAH